jgi:peptide/nickel transport system ATP-binding protein
MIVNSSQTLLNVSNLETSYFVGGKKYSAVDRASVEVHRGEMLGLAGESGCGKTTLGLSLMRMVKPPGRIIGGKILLEDTDLLGLNDQDMRDVRWKRISMVFQAAMNSLNPVKSIGNQIAEPILAHERVEKNKARDRANTLLDLVGVGASRAKSYPHELSGGMKQRAVIAMALACNPQLIIADEPTSALDIVTQRQILSLLLRLKNELELSIILVSHDLSIIAGTCDRVVIMYAGKIVEVGPTEEIFHHPRHPYTQKLIGAIPRLKGEKGTLAGIPGETPDLSNPPPGCRFNPRCPLMQDICRHEEPELLARSKSLVACHFAK